MMKSMYIMKFFIDLVYLLMYANVVENKITDASFMSGKYLMI